MKKKQIGLDSYLFENEQDYLVQSLNFKDRDNILEDIEQSLTNFAPIGLFVSNSKAEYIAEVLFKTNRKIPFVAYDLTPKSLKYLKLGVIDFIIQQNPAKQLDLACSIATDYLIFAKEPNKRNYLPLEVISKENI
jgi:LacI family transcriptional regulator